MLSYFTRAGPPGGLPPTPTPPPLPGGLPLPPRTPPKKRLRCAPEALFGGTGGAAAHPGSGEVRGGGSPFRRARLLK
eukprot:12161531-Alexandrium_andersonii.AAC.1